MTNITGIGKKCSGCRACEQSCVTQAITFRKDAEGFMYPVVDDTLCVGCGLCLSVCPVNTVNAFHNEQVCYAAKTKDLDDLSKCSSGGLFYAMAKCILESGGIVCGCETDDMLMPRHAIATTLEEAKRMRGSKYVQSDMKGIYTQVKSYLEQGVKVLFSGVPCQVAGLRNYLGVEYPDLYCVDIICHGVPSRQLYASYLKWMEEKWGGKVTKLDFRSKKRHQWSLTLDVTVKEPKGKEKEHIMMGSLDPYYYNFLQGNTYRESCYSCAYANANRSGDITIGDFWGVEQTRPELFDIKGLSCALVNSNKGKELWEMIADTIDFEEVIPDDIISHNGNLRAPTRRPQIRDIIYETVSKHGFGSIPYELSIKAKLVDSLKNIIPNRYRFAIKRALKRK